MTSQGKGFFEDVWKGLKTGAKYGYKGLWKTDDFLKKTKLASTGLSVASIFQPE